MSIVGASYDRVAERYEREISEELQAKPLDRALLDALLEQAPDGPVLDLGCGPGHVGHYLNDRGRPVFGLDISPAMCALAVRSRGLPAAVSDLASLPVADRSAAVLVCMYAVIHLDHGQRAAAYAEFARVLVPGGQALLAFHTSDAEVAAGGFKQQSEWWGEPVELTFRFLDPAVETAMLAEAGLELVARLDRAPNEAGEHPSQRSYLLVRLPAVAASERADAG